MLQKYMKWMHQYIYGKKILFLSNNLFSNDTIGNEIPYERSIDIDNLSDYKIVKKLINNTWKYILHI